MKKHSALLLISISFLFSCSFDRETYSPIRSDGDSLFIVNNYEKQELYITMPDGVQLFTAVYSPIDKSKEYPIILFRTPYGSKPYGTEKSDYRMDLGPNMDFVRDGYIFVYQDVRGRFMSEGTFDNMRPQLSPVNDTIPDESKDTYATIDWLVKNVDNNNGKVGQWGISYPGFYTAAGMINSHPALKAASPQAPIADWFYDDFHHNGAFFLPHAFNFFYFFDRPASGKFKQFPDRFDFPTDDGSEFYETVTPLSKVKELYFGDSIQFWNDLATHPNYDDYWQNRNLLPHLKNINCAVLTVGGWFDAEDLYGPLKIYQTVETNNTGIQNTLVMGPWSHGAWRRTEGDFLGDIHFREKTSTFFNNEILYPFFSEHLKGEKSANLAEAIVFETGTNQWRTFDQWPPKVNASRLYFKKKKELSFTPPKENEFGADKFISDPQDPVPYTQYDNLWMPKPYMVEDQSFVSDRKDVLTYRTEPLAEPITLAGPIQAHLVVKTDQGDADWVVKLIDVYPDDHPPFPHQPEKEMGGFQQMVRSEVLRGRFRNDMQTPEPFEKMQDAAIDIELQDVLHTFKKGHCIMIQIQSTWWPMVDLNPQKYVSNIFEADSTDFVKAKHFVGRSGTDPSYIKVGIL